MKLLLDTQCWLWMTAAPDRFSRTALEIVENEATDLLLSAACAWEIAIKHALGKLVLPMKPSEYVESRLRQTRTSPLAISYAHALRAGELPPHHRDPFDRLLVAQSQIEKLPILTADPILNRYDVDVIDAQG